MHHSRLALWGLTGLSALTVALAPVAAASTPSSSAGGHHGPDYTFAVIGDIPYTPDQLTNFPKVVAQINADPDVRLVSHLGDIKSGSTVCSDAYFKLIKADFDQFSDPLVYTIGDNEWTDCHRPNNGAYDPLERLAAVRATFFQEPGRTLGQHPARVKSAVADGYPENVRFTRDHVAFASVHIVGSNNSLEPWTGNTAPTPAQTAEVLGRTASTLEVIKDTFAAAKSRHDRAVVLMTQADMFDTTVTDPSFDHYYAFQPIVAAIARESAAFGGPVYLFNGDSHEYRADYPLASGSTWLTFYDVQTPVPNLNRITVDGSTNASNYLRVTISRHGQQPLSWVKVPFSS